jgi:rhodanese-related sulfurtransferase
MIFSQRNRTLIGKERFDKAMKETIILIVVTIIVAFAFNLLRQSGIPLFGFSSQQLIAQQQSSIPKISLSEAHDLYLKKKIVFVDARDPISFEEGHIAGSINIYPDEIAIHLSTLKSLLSDNIMVVTYCDGPQCPLSKETAHALLMQGIPNAKVFVDGWRLWLKAGYPTAKGKI